MTVYAIFREGIEVAYYLTAPVIAFFAWKALKQIQVGADQVKAIRDTARTSAQREALRIAAEQTIEFAEHFVPLMHEFQALQKQGQYPKISAAKVEESWPNIQCHFHDLPR